MQKPAAKPKKPITIDCIADLHGEFPILEGGDLLIIAGDITGSDHIKQWCAFYEWLKQQKYRKKIMIAGNHDGLLAQSISTKEAMTMIDMEDEDVEYLCDNGTELEGWTIWGSPWSLWFHGINPHCKNFTGSENHLTKKFEKIPHDIDILITHSPPYGVLDECRNGHVGSKYLYNWLKYVGRPYLHVFGHIHESHGQVEHFPTYDDKMMISVNASIMDGDYEAVNKPIRVTLQP